MEPHPDSALSILQAIRTTDLIGDDERARYALLLTQAMDKNYIDVTDDSLIAVADSYYRRASDPRRRMLAAFYHGRVRFNASDYPRALQLFSESLDLASALPDTFWMARSASEISYVYERNYHPKEELSYSKKALEYYNAIGQQPYVDYAWHEYGLALLNDGQYADACRIAHQVQDSAIQHIYPNLHIEAIELEAHSYINSHQYSKAIPLLEDLFIRERLKPEYIDLLAYAYCKTGQSDRIQNLGLNRDDASTQESAPDSYRICLAIEEKDYKQAYKLTHKLLQYHDSVLGAYLNSNLTKGINDYRKYETTLHNMEIQNLRLRYTIYIIAALVLLTGVIMFFIRSIRQQRAKLESQYAVAENLREILSLKETKYSEAQQEIRNLFAGRFEIIDKLCSTYYATRSLKSANKKIADELESIVTELSEDSVKLKDIAALLDAKQDGILTKFRSDFPNLKPHDYLLFLYQALGFSANAIALFLHEDKVTTIYNRKFRLKLKIKGSTSTEKQYYLSILG